MQMAERQTAELKGSDEGSDAQTHELLLKLESETELCAAETPRSNKLLDL